MTQNYYAKNKVPGKMKNAQAKMNNKTRNMGIAITGIAILKTKSAGTESSQWLRIRYEYGYLLVLCRT